MIKVQKKLEDLTEVLVPEAIRLNSPQFYNLIKSFLINIQKVQDSININFIDTVDFDRIQNVDYKLILAKMYLGQFQIDKELNIDILGDVIKISKDLSTTKGTAKVYEILIRLLLVIVPGVNDQYSLLLEEYNNETDPIRKAELEYELILLEETMYNEGIVAVEEEVDEFDNIIPFKYSVVADIDSYIYNTYIKPFAHISGWDEEFIQGVRRIVAEIVDFGDSITLYDKFSSYPAVPLDDSNDFPETSFNNALLGAEINYNDIASKFVDTSNLYIDSGSVYYDWDLFKNPETIEQYDNDNTYLIKSACIDDMLMIYGGYTADLTGIAICNGALTFDNDKLVHRIYSQKTTQKINI